MTEIFKEDILSYKTLKKSHSDYTYGGWYLIKCICSGKMYIGKSIEYMSRLRQHIKIKNPKINIDKEIKENGIDNFKFYLVLEYSFFDVTFSNRKIEQKIEHRLISFFNTKHPTGYNISHYERL